MSETELRAKIAKAIKKLPQWLRHDLNAADAAVRQRAEESLAAIITAAIAEANG